MNAVFDFLTKHGYSVLFAAVFVHQIGLPVPGPLFLIAAGALAAMGKMVGIVAFMVAVIACVLADWPWYEAGRRQGDRVLHFIHRLTRDPDAHDRRAKRIFSTYGPPLLLTAKFVPGLDAVVPPLAGTSNTRRAKFLSFDAAGSALYAGAYGGLGYLLSHDLNRAAAYVGRASNLLAMLVAMLVAVLIAFFGARQLLRRYRLTHEFGSRGRHEFICLNLRTPSPLPAQSVKGLKYEH